MTAGRRIEQLAQCLMHVLARGPTPEERVREIVGNGTKQIRAFNLADGTRTQLQISRATGIDQGNLSRTFQRWVDNGVAFWIGEGKDMRLLHLYSIAPNGKAAKSPKRRTRT